MRKAVVAATGGRRNNRRGSNSKQETTQEAPPSAKLKQVSPEKQQQQQPKPKQQQVPKTKMSADEAALTAKNYRLAKELSELRVRHREESKTVTKLTMENMNLASRCREAISQVAMLKKELAIQKRRGEELNRQKAQQQQQAAQPRASPSPQVSPSKQQQPQSLEEMSRMDRILAAHQQARTESPMLLTPTSSPKPKAEDVEEPVADKTPPSVKPPAVLEEQKDSEEDIEDEIASPHLVSSDDYEEDDIPVENTLTEDDEASQPPSLTPSSKNTQSPEGSVESSPSPSSFKGILREKSTSSQVDVDAVNVDEDDDYDEEEMGDSMPSPAKAPSHGEGLLFPQTASPNPRASYNEEFPGDITAPAVRHHHHLHQPRLGRFDESSDDYAGAASSNEDPPLPPEQQPGPFERLRQRSAMSTISSIDAFEASFQTDFPESFSPREDSEKKSTTDAYNPFSPSPQRPGFNSSEDEGGDNDDDDEPEPPVRSHQSSSPSSSIRERALLASSAYRRASGNRLSSASDPPGRDRTSTRKAKAPVASVSQPGLSPSGNKTPSPSSARKVVTDDTSSSALTPSRLASERKSPLFNTSPKMKLPLFNGVRSPKNDGSTVSPRFFRRTSPVTPSSLAASEVYRTPSPMPQPSPHGILEPPRPEKTGHEQARARFEKAYGSSKHKVNGVDTSFATTSSDASDSIPGMSNRARNGIRARVAEYEKASSPMKMKSQFAAMYAPPHENDDGDIPMRSSISKGPVSPSKNKNSLLFDASRNYGSARGIDVSEDDELRLNPNKGRELLYGGQGYSKSHSASNLMRSEEVVRNAWR